MKKSVNSSIDMLFWSEIPEAMLKELTVDVSGAEGTGSAEAR